MSEKRNIFQEVGTDTKIASAATGTITRTDGAARGAVATWLWALAALIVVMILVGGLTRLTDSGLSITEWAPVMGAIPPMSAAAWDAAFAAYQTTTEFKEQNASMTMADFKVIYWWEWGHRQMGRFIGLFWLVGFLAFLVLKKLPPARRTSLFLIGPFIAVQGLIGWLMVRSGLDALDVKSYWLMAHLGAAFALLGFVIWQALILGRAEADLLQARRNRPAKLWSLSTGLMHFVFLQILLGALVAGIDAGRNYPDWPLMAGGFFPPDMFDISPWWRNFFENDGLVQFIHRISAYLLFGFGIYVGMQGAKAAFKRTRSAFGTVGIILILQMIMGIVTVMYSSPLQLAIVHQFLAILLWFAIVRARFLTGYPMGETIRGT